MTREQAINLLRENLETIKGFGVRRIGLFGSVVRNEISENSDIDIVVEFEKGRGGIEEFADLCDYLENLFGREIDILTPYGIESIRIPYIKREIKNELIYV